MDIAIRHGKVEVSPALRTAVEEKVSRVARFLEGMDRAEVRFSEERNPRIADKEVCEVTMHGHGHVVRARAAAPDSFAAVDRVVDKLEHRMEKLKGKLLGRSHPRKHPSVDFPLEGIGADDEGADAEPRIVKTKKFEMKPMTPEEAALQMDLVGHEFYFFTSSETGQAGVVYRRNDGQIGLIEAG
jgi:putative sigma-54 modulation protein